jgi:PncC family amidohydrolase
MCENMKDVLSKTEELKEKLFSLLCERNLKISTAESCTGGMIGASITSIPGISAYYECGFVTYSNEAKQKLIGVNKETLDEFGAVSGETVLEMAQGALEKSGADIAVSVSGIAGPGGGTAEKPVGLVYIGCASEGKNLFEKYIFKGNREEVRQQTVNSALEMIIKRIENK